ncbi:MAG TPA: oligosaccharide flippase family protein [Thermodesulfobacteriota bacterium]|nr:oligosaccharide flippase family protein [Thermodesulfobacteriota bacterium]
MSRGVLWAWMGTFITNLVIVACGFITGVLTARFLLPEGRGALAAVIFWSQLTAGIGIMSLPEATTYRIGRWPERASEIISTAFWLAICLSFIVTTLGYMAIPSLLGIKRQELWNISKLYLLVFIPFNFIGLTLLAIDQGGLRFSIYNRLRLLGPVIYLLGLVLLWITGHITVAWIVAMNASATVIAALIRVFLAGTALLYRPSFSEAWGLLRDGWSFHLATLLIIAANQADIFVILRLWDNKIIGLYMAAFTVAASALNLVGSTFHTVLFPTLVNTQEKNLRTFKLMEGIRQAMFLLFVITVPLMVLAPKLVPLLFGEDFRPASMLSVFLLLAYFLIALKTIVIRSLRGFGEGLPGATAQGLSVILFLVIVWPLSARLYVAGVAVALIMANMASLFYLGFYLKQNHGVELRQCWGLTPATVRQFCKAIRNLFGYYKVGTEVR